MPEPAPHIAAEYARLKALEGEPPPGWQPFPPSETIDYQAEMRRAMIASGADPDLRNQLRQSRSEPGVNDIRRQASQLGQLEATLSQRQGEYNATAIRYVSLFLDLLRNRDIKALLFEGQKDPIPHTTPGYPPVAMYNFGSSFITFPFGKINHREDPFYYDEYVGRPNSISLDSVSAFMNSIPNLISTIPTTHIGLVAVDDPRGGITFAFELIVETPSNKTKKRRDDRAMLRLMREKLYSTGAEYSLRHSKGHWDGRFINDSSGNRMLILRKTLGSDFYPYIAQYIPPMLQTIHQQAALRIATLNTQLQERQSALSAIHASIEIITRQLQADPYAYTSQQVHEFAQQAANATIQTQPDVQQMVYQGVPQEQLRQLVATMIEERLGAYQPNPHRRGHGVDTGRLVHQIARGDKRAEGILDRFIRRTRDPERVAETLLTLTYLIPGAQQLVIILEAINLMFGPDEQH